MKHRIYILLGAVALVLIYLTFKSPAETDKQKSGSGIGNPPATGKTAGDSAVKDFFGAVFSRDAQPGEEPGDASGIVSEIARLEGMPSWAWEPPSRSPGDARRHADELKIILDLEGRIAAGTASPSEKSESLERKTRILEEKCAHAKNVLHSLGQEQKQGRDVAADAETWRLRLYILERKLESYQSGVPLGEDRAAGPRRGL